MNKTETKALSVGCSDVTRWIPGTEGLDIIDHGQKWVCSFWDFKAPYEYDVVYSHHFIEHFDNTVDLMEKFGEILKEGGILDIRVPTLPYPHIFIDPTHKKIIPNEVDKFFGYFTKDSFSGHCYTKCMYEIVGIDRDRFEWEAHITLRLIKKA